MRHMQIFAILIITAFTLSACGVRGPLEPPPGPPPADKDKPIVLDKLIR